LLESAQDLDHEKNVLLIQNQTHNREQIFLKTG